MNHLRNSSLYVAPLGVLFALWQVSSYFGILPKSVLPPFFSVMKALWDLVVSGEIFPHVLASFYRSFMGLGLAILFGVALGLGMARIRGLYNFFDPLLTLVYPIPKPAMIPLFMIWLGIGDFSKITVIMMGSQHPGCAP